jgi:hypothetical protein
MAVEVKRGCGYRKIGGTYLEAPAGGFACGRMPLLLHSCPLCDYRPPFTRGVQRIHPKALLVSAPTCRRWVTTSESGCRQVVDATACSGCPLSRALESEVAGLMWVGDRFYTPETFTEEARELGISKRIPNVPKWLKPGKTWIFLAHQRAATDRCQRCVDGKSEGLPGTGLVVCEDCGGSGRVPSTAVFTAFVPSRVVRIVGDDMPEEGRQKLRDQGLEPVVVPHDDPDHRAKREDE